LTVLAEYASPAVPYGELVIIISAEKNKFLAFNYLKIFNYFKILKNK